MQQKLSGLFRRFSLWRWRHAVLHSLALHRRGEARTDGLTLVSARANVEICWRAREPHPWDCHLHGRLQTAAFTSQAFDDTQSALGRLFEAIPGVESIDVKVLDRCGDRPIIEGKVSRRDFQEMLSAPSRSARMRLKSLGLQDWLPLVIDGSGGHI